MADQADISQRISQAKQAGYSDSDIYSTLSNDASFQKRITMAKKEGFTDEQIAGQLGLKVGNSQGQHLASDGYGDVVVDGAEQDSPEVLPERHPIVINASRGNQSKQQDTPAKPEQPSFLADVGAGMDKVFSGAIQGAHWLGDKIQKPLNDYFGTHFDTNEYQKYTKQKADEYKAYEKARTESGAGTNYGEFLGEMAATAPAAVFARGYQGAKILSTAGAKVLGQNALLGSAIGGAQFAENSDQRLSNVGAGAVGGAAGAVVGEKIGQGITKAAAKYNTTAANIANIDQKLEEALNKNGVSLSDLSSDVVDGLRKNAVAATKSGKDLNPDAVARQALFGKLGLKGTQSQVTRSSQQWQKEAELAKIQGAGDPLRNKFNQDNVQLKGLLDDAASKTGGTSIDQYGAMQGALDTANSKLASNKANYQSLYDQARQANGNNVVLDGAGFTNDAITALDKNYAMSSLPPSIHKILKDVSNNSDKFTLGKSEELIKILNREYKASLQNGQPSSSTYAIGLVRDALNTRQNEAMQNLLSQGNNDAARLYSSARQAFKDNVQSIENMPLLKDAQNGVEPDKLFQKHVLNGNVSELSKTVNLLNDVNPQSVNDIKQQVIEYISNQAINSNGQFSPAGMKRALDKIGDRRLETMFDPKEVSRLRDIGMAGHFLVSQPPHSYVNNSNTGSALANFLIGRLNLPGVRILASPVNDIIKSREVNKTLKPSIAGNDLQIGDLNQSLIDQLRKAGLLSGANAATQ
ncbi:hypothetical protein P255_01417 [Acinetobacter brisouii CIP 110357]|uniref:Uncharacterized protein n=1 Tax=Acinetobacter brisouii CIP 110357 TaxID=1341683 RepID=V2U941_9GAMM|nr:hypothetical protein [Acinetobacter brisouii]ENV46057.1 hypothetical protein F954_02883 [Acinetobacter brisouii ANC 4119]ESK50918.1 hypothetical protein P255_01417 [Acinetobacter brisouii CIP 110357]